MRSWATNALILVGGIVAAAFPARGRTDEAATCPDCRLTGGLAWIFSEDLDLLGTMRADLPVRLSDEWSLFASVDLRTAILKSLDDFTFALRDIDYRFEIGTRWSLPGGSSMSLILGQRGLEGVDAPGQSWVRLAGAGLSTGARGWSVRRHRWDLEAAAGGVVEDREVDASWWARGSAHWTTTSIPVAWGADLEIDAMGGAVEDGADVRGGPRLILGTRDGRSASFYLHYVRGHHPLGLRASGTLVGFDLTEGPSRGFRRVSPPDIRGTLSAGGGDGRGAGRFLLDVSTPELFWGLSAVIAVDANVLTAEETGDLFYLYHVGIEKLGESRRQGVYFSHRSNHQLAEPNDRITSRNVIEAGWESAGWERPLNDLPRGRAGRLDYRLRPGYVITSDFGEDPSWNLRWGARWAFPLGTWLGFLGGEGEAGDTDRQSYTLGVALPRGWEIAIEHRADDQLFALDREVTLAVGTFRF